MAWAGELARADGCRARFVVGDAFEPGLAIEDPEATVVISSGVLHHIPATDLPGFFAAHHEAGVAAFAHYDPEPGPLTSLGAWVFHRARMRVALSRHDGNLLAMVTVLLVEPVAGRVVARRTAVHLSTGEASAA